MSAHDYPRFLSECIIDAPDKQPGLREDEMYGLYLSWCLLNNKKPAPDHAFWEAMSARGHTKVFLDADRHHCPGLGMKGPAAVDYILASQPSIV